DELQALRVPARDDGELRVRVDAVARVDQLSVDLAAQRGLGEPWPDRRGNLGDGDGLVELPHRVVRQRYRNHFLLLVPTKKRGRAALFRRCNDASGPPTRLL